MGCGVWRGSCGWWFWGFCFSPRLRRDLREALRRRLTVAAAGVFLSVVGVAEVGLRVFSSAPVVAVVSAALWCRDWGLALPAAALLALFLAALAAG